jgi:hypothetical protein
MFTVTELVASLVSVTAPILHSAIQVIALVCPVTPGGAIGAPVVELVYTSVGVNNAPVTNVFLIIFNLLEYHTKN